MAAALSRLLRIAACAIVAPFAAPAAALHPPAAAVEQACRRGWPSSPSCPGMVAAFLAGTGDAPVWLEGGVASARARVVAVRLGEARRKGLRPEDYGGCRWAERLDASERPCLAMPPDAAAADLDLTVSALRYVSDLARGRIEPQRLRWAVEGRVADEEVVAVLRRVRDGSDPDAALAAAEPPFATYRRTLAALERYAALAAEGEGDPIPVPPRKVSPGDVWSGVAPLAALLRRLGDLPPDAQLPPGDRYGGALVEAVKSFQRRHGGDPDGVLGAGTVRALRVPLARRLTQLELTLERWRWLPRQFGGPPVFVNIPEFRLYALDPSGERLSMKVVVGKAFDAQTPVFAADMRHVLFRPPWNVPLKIQRHELAPAIARDPRYLARHDYQVVDPAGAVVTEGPVDPQVLAALRAGSLHLRQRPGPRNSLGLIKFVLPNRYDVYLHGTPAQKLFARARRDFSHGCIRVEDPVALAAWVLRGRPGWTVERIRAAMQAETSLQVDLARPVPVLVVYGTALVDERGEVRFLEDLYGLDAALEQALAGGAEG